jgi:hypothetical protein
VAGRQSLVSSRRRGLLLCTSHRTGRAGLASRHETPLELILDKARIFEQPHNLCPNHIVKEILANRAVIADGTRKMPIGVGAKASIIVDLTTLLQNCRAVVTARRVGDIV